MKRKEKKGAIPNAEPSLAEVKIIGGEESRPLGEIFPAWAEVGSREAVMVGMPASGSAYFSPFAGFRQSYDQIVGAMGQVKGSDRVPLRRFLPEQRGARYAVLRFMSKDPTIDSAVKMHISNALSAKSNTVDSVFIKERFLAKKRTK